MSLDLDRFNALAGDEAVALLLPCCGSRAWARRLAASRPFQDLAGLQKKSDEIWRGLGGEDWREAFAAHPRIGENGSRWSGAEQAGVRDADAETRAELVAANREYEARFAHLFIVCATGKTAAEMLSLLRHRLDNDPAIELLIAAEEQRKITNLRLEKFFLKGINP
ncbi:MAG: 2-oxo-4-hydroxy-4-carboxy-5-ureidoimidazoline decarboxylase [Thermoanaerobaculia bacterium]